MLAAVNTPYAHISLAEDGTPTIAGSTTKVVELVGELYAYGWSPAEMRFQHPHLTLGQIHSALAYYFDHREILDKDLERRIALGETLRQSTAEPPIVHRLRSLKQGA